MRVQNILMMCAAVLLAGAVPAMAQAPTCATNTGALTWTCTFPSAADPYWSTSGANIVLVPSGSVGIGTATPAAKLHVAGNVQVDGNIAAKYQDVAEWVTAKHPLEAGTVVVIGKGETNIVDASSRSYDTAVVGVVSARPGLVLGEGGDGKVLVAQSGRVRVKVDASFGAVEEGDLLVTSPTPGVAMKSQPVDVGGTTFHRPGTLLGKALQSLPSGEGEILVLLTLQ